MSYTPRLTAPSETDPRNVNTAYGGYNGAIVINSSNGCVMPNCVGYVHFRAMEMNDLYSDVPLSLGNGRTFWGYNDGYSRGSEPQLGAVLCFDQSGGAGHVCIVEQIIDADTIVTSDSNYGAEYFVLRTRTRANGWNWYSGSPLVFQGFIYVYEETPPGPDVPPTMEELAIMSYLIRKRKRGESL